MKLTIEQAKAVRAWRKLTLKQRRYAIYHMRHSFHFPTSATLLESFLPKALRSEWFK